MIFPSSAKFEQRKHYKVYKNKIKNRTEIEIKLNIKIKIQKTPKSIEIILIKTKNCENWTT